MRGAGRRAVCRFFAPARFEDERRAKANALLESIDALPADVHCVEFEGVRCVCDADPVTKDRPHRFFDASTAVAR